MPAPFAIYLTDEVVIKVLREYADAVEMTPDKLAEGILQSAMLHFRGGCMRGAAAAAEIFIKSK